MRKTGKSKPIKMFKIVPIAVEKKNEIIIDGTRIEYSPQGKVLGLTFSRTGIEHHVNEIVLKGKRKITELYRFRKLPEKIRIHLLKAFITPILQYPPIPIATTSKTKQEKLQKVLNRALRFAYNERYPHRRPLKALHEQANIEPINYSLYERAKTILAKTQDLGELQMNYLIENYEEEYNYPYFSKTKKMLDRGPPGKIYATH